MCYTWKEHGISAHASLQYRAKDKPWFSLGHGIILIYIFIALISSIAYRILLKRENARRDRGERDEVIIGLNDDEAHLLKNGSFASVEDAKREKGDNWSGYRYIV